MTTLNSVFTDFTIRKTSKPAIAPPSALARSWQDIPCRTRTSPVLSRQELQRLIRDMVG